MTQDQGPEEGSAARPPRRRTRRPRPKPKAEETESTARPKKSTTATKPKTAPVPATPEKEEGAEAAKRRRRRRPRRPRAEVLASGVTPRTMLISTTPERSQIAVLENRELIEHYVARSDDRSIVGNIYLGKVQNVLPGMEAAFIDIGVERNAVLYAGEVSFDEELEGEPPRIEKVLKSGQALLAQVTKDPMRSKGARLTTEISVPGRYIVLVPGADSIGISRRLPDDERKRLRDVAARIQPPGYGLIVRTAATGSDEAELDRDVVRLVEAWYEVNEKTKKKKPPLLVYEEPELVIRVVRDLFTRDVVRAVCDDPKTFQELTEYISQVTPQLAERIELHEGPLSLFETHHVVEQIRKALDRKVWLPSRGHIVIERVEALTVIDVNTGKFVGKTNLEETVLQTNIEAAQEIAKQLRLRDIGGIIVIDFIDMIHEHNRDEVLRVFREALGKDKTTTQVYGISELGLVQMTRKNVSAGLLEAFSTACDKCNGWGVILSDLD